MLITSKGIWYTTPKKKVPSFKRTRVIKTWQSKLKQKPSDMQPEGFFVPGNVVPKVRIELTQGHPYRFLSMMRFVLISFIMKPTH